MPLTLIPAGSGHGLILRDTHTRHEVYISDTELLDIGTALIQAASVRAPVRPPRYRPRRDPL